LNRPRLAGFEVSTEAGVERADVLACIAYGAEMSRERFVDVPPSNGR
jgi:hypothetical protein